MAFKMMGKSPMMRSLIGKQNTLPENLQDAIKDSPEPLSKSALKHIIPGGGGHLHDGKRHSHTMNSWGETTEQNWEEDDKGVSRKTTREIIPGRVEKETPENSKKAANRENNKKLAEEEKKGVVFQKKKKKKK